MYDDLRYRAGTVLGECAATGFVLGGVSAFGAVLVAGAIAGSANRPVVLVAYGWICAGLGSAVGTTVGLGVGVALYLLVRWGEPRLGARVVARLIPAVALCLTMPLAVAVGAAGDAAWFASIAGIVALLTLVGAGRITHRYLGRAVNAATP